MPAPDVVGIAEIARLLGVGKSYAREVALSKSFPDPARLTMGLVWDGAEVRQWIAAHRPPPDEPED